MRFSSQILNIKNFQCWGFTKSSFEQHHETWHRTHHLARPHTGSKCACGATPQQFHSGATGGMIFTTFPWRKIGLMKPMWPKPSWPACFINSWWFPMWLWIIMLEFFLTWISLLQWWWSPPFSVSNKTLRQLLRWAYENPTIRFTNRAADQEATVTYI